MLNIATWLHPEERAYNTPNGGHSRSRRHGRAIYPDGVIRSVTAGVPDTYFSIPAHGRVRGRYVSGWLTVNDRSGLLEFSIREQRPRFLLADDGTLDTVVVCERCLAEERFSFDRGRRRDNIRWAKQRAREDHDCDNPDNRYF